MALTCLVSSESSKRSLVHNWSCIESNRAWNTFGWALRRSAIKETWEELEEKGVGNRERREEEKDGKRLQLKEVATNREVLGPVGGAHRSLQESVCIEKWMPNDKKLGHPFGVAEMLETLYVFTFLNSKHHFIYTLLVPDIRTSNKEATRFL